MFEMDFSSYLMDYSFLINGAQKLSLDVREPKF